MATAATKLRKRTRRAAGYPADTQHTKPVKTKTQLEERVFVIAPVFRRAGDAWPKGTPMWQQLNPFGPRSGRRALRFIESGGIKR
ncbi:hypothetical protein MRBLMI12_000440 [Microbacterium sp. LMI12-1-1.1]|uniref:hypothetical protein n=1 Tax=Microbacterium sp. LMI12-1-1.1 TaxID=3135225 RepID=UPI0034217A98